MSHSLISRSSDLKRLRDEGFEVSVEGGYLVIRNVPYVSEHLRIERGALVSSLTLAGDTTAKPDDHVVMFAGGAPCSHDGRVLTEIINASSRKDLGGGLVVDHTFSSKPKGGYEDYYSKMSSYIAMLTSQAQAIDPSATAQTYAVIDVDDASEVFRYLDTAESRAGIAAINAKLALSKVAIVGLGGTGSYVLDLVSKSPVQEIHLVDGDDFLSHNAFRAPGAASLEALRAKPKKVDYFASMYSHLRRGIVPHACYLDRDTLNLLADMDFVFLCMAAGQDRDAAIEFLFESAIPFIDVGMGVYESDGALAGLLRVTSGSGVVRRQMARDDGQAAVGNGDPVYDRNIQIADLNALNAALAVVQWKQALGFYLDFEGEASSIYQIDSNVIIHEKNSV